MDVLVLSGDIKLLDVEEALLTDGIVVLGTTRVGARRIEQQVRERLLPDGDSTADEDDEDDDVLVHLSTDVVVTLDGYSQIEWTHYFVYTKAFKHDLDRAKHVVRQAAAAWMEAGGTQDRFAHRIR